MLATASNNKSQVITELTTTLALLLRSFSPDSQVLATASNDESQLITELTITLALLLRSFSPNGQMLATASNDESARLWDVATGACISSLEAHHDCMRCAAFSPDGASLATSSNDEMSRLWDVATGMCVATLKGHRGAIHGHVLQVGCGMCPWACASSSGLMLPNAEEASDGT